MDIHKDKSKTADMDNPNQMPVELERSLKMTTRASLHTVQLAAKPIVVSTINGNFLEDSGEGAAGAANETVDDILAKVLRQDTFPVKSMSSLALIVDDACPQGVPDEDLVMDPRLRAWNRVLEQRRRLQQRIERETGKRPEDVLFNRPTTIDEASKRMILRVLDTADRSRPLALVHGDSVLDSLKPRCDPGLCREIPEVYAARPLVQTVELVGLPQVIQEELTATATATDTLSKFQRSEFLGNRIQSKQKSIRDVLEFAPDLEELQVVPTVVVAHNQTRPIEKIGVDDMLAISDDSTLEDEEDSDLEADLLLRGLEGEEEDGPGEVEVIRDAGKVGKAEATELDELQNVDGVMINGCLYDYLDMKGPHRKGIHLVLKCDPYQRVVKTLVDIQVKKAKAAIGVFGETSSRNSCDVLPENRQNLSQKLLHVYWTSRNRFRTDHQPMEGELVFDRCEFILEPQGRRQIRALFHPQQVGLTTQRWNLCLVKSPVCGTRRLMVILQGHCTMPDVYLRRLEIHRQVPGEKQQRLQAHSLLNMQASLAPIIENPPLLCPYQRVLDERELFNAQNPSYFCQRYADLEALKDLYALAKKPRDRPWDLTIEGLRRCIGRQEARFLREKLHIELMELLQPMTCSNRCEGLTRMEHSPERDRACFIYVRGTISTAVDKWESMALCLDEQFCKLELLRQRGQEQEKEERKPPMTSLQQQELLNQTVENVAKKVKGSKYLKDALYMQTYSLLCDTAEDIVSVIESTGHL